jgi:hypothetical protein
MAAFGQGPSPWSPAARAREWERGSVFNRHDGRPAHAPSETGRTEADRDYRRPAGAEPGDDFVSRALHRRYQ